jgi:hypothetical protein
LLMAEARVAKAGMAEGPHTVAAPCPLCLHRWVPACAGWRLSCDCRPVEAFMARTAQAPDEKCKASYQSTGLSPDDCLVGLRDMARF